MPVAQRKKARPNLFGFGKSEVFSASIGQAESQAYDAGAKIKGDLSHFSGRGKTNLIDREFRAFLASKGLSNSGRAIRKGLESEFKAGVAGKARKSKPSPAVAKAWASKQISTFEAANIVKDIAADQGYGDAKREYDRNLSSDEVMEYISGHPKSKIVIDKLGKARIKSLYTHEYRQGQKKYNREAGKDEKASRRIVERHKTAEKRADLAAKQAGTKAVAKGKKLDLSPDELNRLFDLEYDKKYEALTKSNPNIHRSAKAVQKRTRSTRRKNVILPGSVTDALTGGATRLVKGSKQLAGKAARAVKKAAKRNPLKKLDDKMKKLGARVTKTGFGKRKYAMPKKRRSNPEAAAERAYKEFTGYDPEVVMDLVEEEHVHAVMVNRGKLIAWEVLNATGKAFTLPMPGWEERKDRGKPYWHFDESMAATDIVWLASSEDGRQLYTKGGDQELDIESLGLEKIDERDHMFIGTIVKVWYAQKKKFEGPDECHFHHAFGKEGSKGVLPLLLYNPRSAKMKIAGGRYQIAEPEGALDGVSPGIIG